MVLALRLASSLYPLQQGAHQIAEVDGKGSPALSALEASASRNSFKHWSFAKKYEYETTFANPMVPGESWAVEFETVSFSYPDGRRAISEVSFKVPVGSIYGLVGPSGTGKSTILDLILGLVEPEKGTVRVGLNSSSGTALTVAIVPQFPHVFSGSIEDNVTLLEPIADAKTDVEQCLRLVGLEDIVADNDLSKSIDSEGRRISGGQAQRLGIARALYQGADILLLDEVTSALDDANTESLKDVLMSLKKSKTIVLVTHDSRILPLCDHILKLG